MSKEIEIYRFEVGRIYHHKVGKERKWSEFRCTARVGNRIVLEERGGKGRRYEGEVRRSAVGVDGYNEILEIGIIHYPSYSMIEYLPAHDFFYGRERERMSGTKIVRDGFGTSYEVAEDVDWDSLTCDERDALIILGEAKEVSE